MGLYTQHPRAYTILTECCVCWACQLWPLHAFRPGDIFMMTTFNQQFQSPCQVVCHCEGCLWSWHCLLPTLVISFACYQYHQQRCVPATVPLHWMHIFFCTGAPLSLTIFYTLTCRLTWIYQLGKKFHHVFFMFETVMMKFRCVTVNDVDDDCQKWHETLISY